jgi:tRNA nucleotidyltransferase/poly(A) polymerase
MWYVSYMTYVERIDTFMASTGLETYRVGGSVRDDLLGRKVKDCDYMIRCAPLREIRGRLHEAGKDVEKFSVAPLVLRDGRQAGWRVSGRGLGLVEIVLPRTEVSTGPGHRDFQIVLDPNLSLEEDAKRRDFTFNALYVRVDDGDLLCCRECDYGGAYPVIDPTGRGQYDLKHRLVNVTHADSFRDDPLRTLRALRFVSTLDYELGPETRWLMEQHADAVTGLTQAGTSGTVLDELGKLLMGQCPAKALRLARDTGVLAVALPELGPMLGFDQGSRYHDMTTDEHTFTALETAAHVNAPLRVRMALLFHDAGKPESAWIGKDGRKHYYAQDGSKRAGGNDGWDFSAATEDHEVVGARIWDEAAERLGADRKLRADVRTLILSHMVPCEKADEVKARRARVRLGDELLRDLYLMRSCDLSGKGNKNAKFLLNVGKLEAARAAAEAAGVPRSPKDLQINGVDVHDALPRGAEGRRIGEVLRGVLDEVVCDPSEQKLTRDWQLAAAARLGRH